MKSPLIALGLLLATIGVATAMSHTQVTTPPTLGSAPTLVMPTVDEGALDNGMRLLVSRNAEVPLVEARLVITGGARLVGVAPGLASFTAGMLAEGAGDRDAFQLAEALDFLGATLGAAAGWEQVMVRLNVPKRNIDSALALLADVVLRPTFAEADVARQRDLRQAALVSARDAPGSVASRVFYRLQYPAGHPYHQSLSGDSTNVAAFDSAAVRDYWRGAFDPARATLVVTGDVTLAEAKAWANRMFGTWASPETPLPMVAATTVEAAPAQPLRIVLVDKPNTTQSVLYIGHAGPSRLSPDYPAITVMNTLLGGAFTSRVNLILREERGYTYGASSGFSWGQVPGPFLVSTAVRADVTDSALAVIVRELHRIRETPPDADELLRSRNYVTLGQTDAFETADQIAGAITAANQFGFPLRRIGEEIQAMSEVTDTEVQRVAREYIDPASLLIVVVGDVRAIRPGIERLRLGPVRIERY